MNSEGLPGVRVADKGRRSARLFPFGASSRGMDLTDTVAIVTGGSGTIGAAVVEELARAGADVAIGYRSDEAGAEAAAATARERGRRARPIQGDLTDPDAASRLVERTEELGSLGVVVLAAGVADPHSIDDPSPAAFRRSLAVNVEGAHNVAVAAAERLASTGGAIVTISSVAADLGTVDASYASAKGGLQGLVRALARELGPDDVRVNAVCPGPVDTPMNDAIVEHLESQRFRGHRTVDTLLDRYEARPEEVAMAVRFLATHEFVTGEILRVDGGMSL